METSNSKSRKPRMQERGYKALTTFVKEAVYHGLCRHAKDVGLSHSKYLAGLIEADLRKKGYLEGIPPTPPKGPPRSGRK